MCDYSLFEHPNRLAVEGEDLVTYRFPSRTLGLASPLDIRRPEAVNGSVGPARNLWLVIKQMFTSLPSPVAVCVPPGARVRLEQIPAPFRRHYGLAESEEAGFVQTTVSAQMHRDALLFETGTQILLQHLPEGQSVRVLSLGPKDEHAVNEPYIQEREDVDTVYSHLW